MMRIREAIAAHRRLPFMVDVEKKDGSGRLSTGWMLTIIFLGFTFFCGSIAALVLVSNGTFDSHKSVSVGSDTSTDEDGDGFNATNAPTPAGGTPFDGGHAGGDGTPTLDFSEAYPSPIQPVDPPASAVIEVTNPPSLGPTTEPIPEPTLKQTGGPTLNPLEPPTPNTEKIPEPTLKPTGGPTLNPLEPPTPTTWQPTPEPVLSPIRTARPVTDEPTSTTQPELAQYGGKTNFYAIGDVPYKTEQAVELEKQMRALPKDCEFLIHVGDLRNAGTRNPVCVRSEYKDVQNLLRLSHAPVFVIIGDNDWTDCENRQEGKELWEEHFIGFESKYWNHTFNIQRQPDYPQNFAFQHKGSLFVGLNIIGGDIHDLEEWSKRLTDEVEWLKYLIREYVKKIAPAVGRVVIFGHANLNHNHRAFENPLVDFIQDELQNGLPILYVNGDIHEWSYDDNYLGEENFLRIMVSGMAQDPPLKVTVNADGSLLTTGKAFAHDRML